MRGCVKWKVFIGKKIKVVNYYPRKERITSGQDIFSWEDWVQQRFIMQTASSSWGIETTWQLIGVDQKISETGSIMITLLGEVETARS